jgi:hypothetical protein
MSAGAAIRPEQAADAPRPFGAALRALTATGKLETTGHDSRRVTLIFWPSPAGVIPPTATYTIGPLPIELRTSIFWLTGGGGGITRRGRASPLRGRPPGVNGDGKT